MLSDVLKAVGIAGLMLATGLAAQAVTAARERTRRDRWIRAARLLGLAVPEHQSLPMVPIREVSHLHLFQRGDRSLALNDVLGDINLFRGDQSPPTNVVQGDINGLELLVFDYRYTVDRGKRRWVVWQTAALARLQARAVPAFELRPEQLLHKLGAFVGQQDIDFSAYPEFSKHYLLRGARTDEVRALFDRDVLRFFAERPSWSVEGGGGWLVMYRSGQRVLPEQLRQFMDDVRHIITLIVRA